MSISISGSNQYSAVLAEVSRDGMKLSQYPQFANNINIVTAAVANNFQAMEYASEDLKSSEDFARSLIGRVRIDTILPYFSPPVARTIEDEMLSSFLDNFSSDEEGKLFRLDDLRVGR
jgi:hypothetical protein